MTTIRFDRQPVITTRPEVDTWGREHEGPQAREFMHLLQQASRLGRTTRFAVGTQHFEFMRGSASGPPSVRLTDAQDNPGWEAPGTTVTWAMEDGMHTGTATGCYTTQQHGARLMVYTEVIREDGQHFWVWQA